MPIYAYRCSTCGHAKDVLQKMSDPVLTVCPECGASTFQKQVTAAGFQLKGSGWYVTDFRGGDKPAGGGDKANDAKADSKADSKADAKSEAKTASGKSDSAPAPASSGNASKSESAPAPAPAAAPPASGTK